MLYRPLKITTGRHPFELSVCGCLALVAAAVALTGSTPTAFTGRPPLWLAIWLTMTFTGSTGTVAGALWPGDLTTALAVEGGALTMLGAALTGYLLLMTLHPQPAILPAAAIVGGLTVACWWRMAQLAHDIRRLARATSSSETVELTVLAEDDGRQP